MTVFVDVAGIYHPRFASHFFLKQNNLLIFWKNCNDNFAELNNNTKMKTPPLPPSKTKLDPLILTIDHREIMR